MSKFFYTYELLSQKDNKYYIGWTNDLIKRYKDHNDGKVASTENRRPLKLVYYEACLSEKNAILREKTLKTGFGRKYIKSRLTKK